MTVTVAITRDTSVNPKSIYGYSVSMNESTGPITPFAQVGPVYNNKIHYRGRFADRAAAVQAILGYVDGRFQLVETTDHLAGTSTVSIETYAFRPRHMDGISRTILGSRSPQGAFVAHA